MTAKDRPLKIVIALSHDPDPYIAIEQELQNRDIPSEKYELIRSEGKNHLDSLIGEIDILIAWSFDREYINRAKLLKWVHFAASGVDGIVYPELLDSSIIVTSSKGSHEQPVAEHTMAMILAYARGIHVSMRNQRERRWSRRSVVDVTVELHEKTLGIVGMGRIGLAIARMGRVFGMRIIGTDRRGRDFDELDHVYTMDELPKVIEESDYLVLALPLTDDTHHLIGLDEIRLMKGDAVLVNIGRGALVDEKVLVEALSRQWIGGALLDVFEEEPLPPNSPLYNLGNVIITPHVGGVTPIYWKRMAEIFGADFERFLAGEPMTALVDKDKGY
ncbi:MAG: D-2-hydroxyacid dehydrogenase [bacterium]|nr:D-2-hydroxyacid dehydrogenase [bacterium]